jgi:hypothetical protein
MPQQDKIIKGINENPSATFLISRYNNTHEHHDCWKVVRLLYERITKEGKRSWKPVAVMCPNCKEIALLEKAAMN